MFILVGFQTMGYHLLYLLSLVMLLVQQLYVLAQLFSLVI